MAARRTNYSDPFAAPYEGGLDGLGFDPSQVTYAGVPGGTAGPDQPPPPQVPPSPNPAPNEGLPEPPHQFDPYAQVGHEGSIGGMNREQYRDAWMSSGVHDQAGAKAWLGAHGGKWVADNGSVLTPFGETLDMLGNSKGSAAGHGQATPSWGGIGGPSGGGGVGGGGFSALVNGPGTPMPAPGGGPAAPQPGGGSSGSSGFGDLKSQIAKLFPDGAFNQGIVDRRTESAKENLMRQRKSQLASDRASLASRGTLGSGPEISAIDRLNSNIDDQYSSAVSGIYADESGKADARMVQALQLAAGMTQAEAQNAIEQFRAQTESQNVNNQFQLGQGRLSLDSLLGQGQLALGNRQAGDAFTLGSGRLALDNMNGVNSYNLGLGRLGLDRDTSMNNSSGQDYDRLISLIQTLMHGAGTSAGGYA